MKARKYMRHTSTKTAKLNRTVNPIRAAYVAEKFTCECCCKRQAVDLHEIVRGANRQKAIQYRACWLALCRACHELLGDYSIWPPARQVALKLLRDPEHFDIEKIKECRGDNRVNWEAVSLFLEMKVKE